MSGNKWDEPGVAVGIDQCWDSLGEEQFREAVAVWVGPAKGPNISLLDVGCGSARFAPLLKGYRYKGIDGSKEMLKIAESRVAADKLFHGDLLEGLPFPDQSFHTVLCNQVLRHMGVYEDVLFVVSEIFRVAKKRIFIVDAFRPDPYHGYSTTERAGQTFPDNSWSMLQFLHDLGVAYPDWATEKQQLLEWVCGVKAELR